MFNFTDVRSREKFEVLRVNEEWRLRRKIEAFIARKAEGQPFTVPGYSFTANRPVLFRADFTDGAVNWRESLVCPVTGMNNRHRAALAMFTAIARPGHRVYFLEQVTPVYRWVKRKVPDISLTGSEYLGDTIPAGTYIDGIRHEDVTWLRFGTASFDIVVSLDVLEHVPHVPEALQEKARVLNPGGRLLMTVPFHTNRNETVTRSVPDDHSGLVRHIRPPIYHGNPVNPHAGSLVYHEFGWSLLDMIRDAGFSDVVVRSYWSMKYGHLGCPQLMFIATR